MKKRFKNILVKNRKKNGIFILTGAVVLTISLGTLVGCSVANVPEQSESKVAQTDPIPADNASANNTLENTATLTFLKEGDQEQKQATHLLLPFRFPQHRISCLRTTQIKNLFFRSF